jgi:hypothetical protein
MKKVSWFWVFYSSFFKNGCQAPPIVLVMDSRCLMFLSDFFYIFSGLALKRNLALQEGLIEEGTPAAESLSKGDLAKRKQ